MNISSFDDLLVAARQQVEPQRLLFVFASAELPPDSTAAQREHFLAGQGGALVPVMCVDKIPGELLTFADLVQESRQFGQVPNSSLVRRSTRALKSPSSIFSIACLSWPTGSRTKR